MKTPLLLADTDLLRIAGVEHLLHQDVSLEWVGSVRSQQALESALPGREPGIAMIAHALLKDPQALVQLCRELGFRLVVLLSQQQEPPWEYLGAFDGVIVPTAGERDVLACLHTVARGSRCGPSRLDAKPKPVSAGGRVLAQLSPRQVQILTAVARGEKNAAIAQRLGTTEQVVKNLLRGIYDLTGVSDRLELALYVLHHPELAIGTGSH